MTLSEYEIMPMTERDLDEVTVLERKCFTVPWSRESFEDVMKYGFLGGYCVRCGAELVGYGVLHCLFEDAEILDIAVAEAFRGRGIGGMLMARMENEARLQGAERIMLEVRSSNEAAKALYRANGYRVTGERKNYYKNPTENAILMEKTVDKQ